MPIRTPDIKVRYLYVKVDTFDPSDHLMNFLDRSADKIDLNKLGHLLRINLDYVSPSETQIELDTGIMIQQQSSLDSDDPIFALAKMIGESKLFPIPNSKTRLVLERNFLDKYFKDDIPTSGQKTHFFLKIVGTENQLKELYNLCKSCSPCPFNQVAYCEVLDHMPAKIQYFLIGRFFLSIL